MKRWGKHLGQVRIRPPGDRREAPICEAPVVESFRSMRRLKGAEIDSIIEEQPRADASSRTRRLPPRGPSFLSR